MRFLAAALSVCLVCLTPGWEQTRAAPPCPPTALVKGDLEATLAIRDTLSKQGVSTQGVGDCPVVTASVEKNLNGLLVKIEDPDGRRSERLVVGNDAAASIIGSWTRGDLNRSMLFPDRPVSDNPVSDAQPLPSVKTGAVIRSVTSKPIGFVDLAGAVSGGFDGSVFFGGNVMGCLMLGPLCAGPAAGISADQGLSGDTEMLGTRRLVADLKASADYPILFQSFSLRPGIQAGALWLRTAKTYSVEGEARSVERADWELALGGYLIGSMRLGRGFSLIVGASVTVLPFARTTPFRWVDWTVGDDDDDNDDNDDNNNNNNNDNLEPIETRFAGLPRGIILGFVGLEYVL